MAIACVLAGLAGCADDDPVVEPAPTQPLVIPLEVDLEELARTGLIEGSVTIPSSVGSIDSVYFRWVGTTELGTATCLDFDPPPDSGPVVSFSAPFAEMSAWWSAEDKAGGPGAVSGEKGLRWLHIAPPEERIVDAPWDLLIGRDLDFTITVRPPNLFDCSWVVEPQGTLTSVSLVVLPTQ